MQYLKNLLQKLSFIKDAIKKVPYKKASVLVALSAGTIFLSANVALKDIKQPKIEWNTKKLEITVFQGTSKIESPFFISNKDLENVKLELVPELAKFISVQPSEISNITAGQKQLVSLLFSVPRDTELGTYEGTLHLKLDKKTIPQTLKIILNVKDPTSDYIPDSITLPSGDRITEDPVIGQNYIKDEIIVKFKDGVSETKIKQAVQAIGGVFIGFLKDLEIYQIQVNVADFSELDQKIIRLEQNSAVDFAGRQVVTIPSL